MCFPLALVYFISYFCFLSYLDICNIPVQALENWGGVCRPGRNHHIIKVSQKLVRTCPGADRLK